MIEYLIGWSLRNAALTIAGAGAMALLGIVALARTPVDAIPDLSENQVIVHAAWTGRSPREVEDHVTRPLSEALRGTARIRALRASSEFGFAMIDLVFEDGVDVRAARSQIVERLSSLGGRLPAGVTPTMAPDATALGQIFWYTIEFGGEEGGYDLGGLRTLQDVHVGPALAAVPGVAEVAAVGGLRREWQVDLDPGRLQSHGIGVEHVVTTLSQSHGAVGAGVVQKANAEFVVRGTSELRGRDDLESVVVADREGLPVRVRDVGTVQLGGASRRSVLEKDGREAVGGVVLMRHGENPLAVTRSLHAKIREISPALPRGIRIVPFYERTRLIESALSQLARTVTVEVLIAAGVVLLVMRHLGASLVVCATLPLSVLGSFVLMRAFSVPTNLMSLAGIAVSIGVLVDQAIVLSDNAMHRLRERFGDAPVRGDLREFLVGPCQEVGRPVFFALLVMLVSFLPVFALSGIEGKMFHPFAWTKTFVLLGAALLTVTLVPALLPLVLRGRMRADDSSAVVRSVVAVYRPLLTWLMERHRLVVLLFAAILAFGWLVASRLGREFLPPLDEGSILDMPVTAPRVSITQAADDLRARDEVLRGFPEVASVVGKAGRAETATDPSPIDMVETVIDLRTREAWPMRHLEVGSAADAVRSAMEGLREAGVFADSSDEAADACVAEATAPLGERLDAELRGVARARQEEAHPRVAEVLALAVVEETVAFMRGADRILTPPDPADLASAAAAVAERHGEHLARGPLRVDVQRAVEAAAGSLVHAGVVHAGSDLLVERRSFLSVPADAVRAALTGAEAPDLFERIHGRLADRHEELWEDHAAALRPVLVEHAQRVLPDFALDAALDAARARSALTREPTPAERHVASERVAARSTPRLVQKSKEDLIQEMDAALRVPGWANIWTQPIVNRIDMLTTGIRTTVGVKVLGDDVATVQSVASHVAEVLRGVSGAADVFADQAVGKGYVEVEVDRERAALAGVSPRQVLDAVEVAVGGRVVAEVASGRERVPVRVRLSRSTRVDEEALRSVPVATSLRAVAGSDRGSAVAPAPAAMAMSGSTSGHAMGGTRPKSATVAAPRREDSPTADGAPPAQVALGDVAAIRVVEGPSMIRSEDGRLCAYVQMNVRGRDVVGFVEEARRTVERFVDPPPGVTLGWSGQYEHQVRARRTLALVVPAVLLLILAILYVTYRDILHAGLVMLAVPGALAGGVVCQALLGFDFSVTAWVGYLACFGMATETGIVMLVYLRDAVARAGGVAGIRSIEALRAAVLEGAVRRMRPKLLTEATTVFAIAPLLFADGVGAEILRPMAAPVLGGILVADEVIDMFLPVLFFRVERWRWERRRRRDAGAHEGDGPTEVAGSRVTTPRR